MSYLDRVLGRRTPQSAPIPGTSQVPNSAGGFAWAVDEWTRLRRFLVLGSEGGSFYAGEWQLTRENAVAVERCLAADGPRAVAEIVAVSRDGRAPRNDAAIFALAMAAGVGDEPTRRAALDALPDVCRTGTHLFQFARFVEGFRGWGRGLRRAVGRWYTAQEPAALAYQAVKYRQREGYTHRDVLRLAHPASAVSAGNPTLSVSGVHGRLFEWIARGGSTDGLPAIVDGFVRAQAAATAKEAAALVREFRLPREAIQPEHLGAPEVWEALLEDMPMTALLRNLATLTRVGVVAPGSAGTARALEQLSDGERLRRARVHPIAVLGNVEPAGKRHLLALDVSGSMTWGEVAGVPGLTPRDASAAMALVTAATEPAYEVVGFTTGLTPLAISPRQRLEDAVRTVSDLPFGGTDCALPMLYAMKHRREVDVFVVYTDSETWAGRVHPAQALREYRQRMGIAARLVVIGMLSNGFSIADPGDPGMLDVVGFDTATPAVVAGFARGEL